MPNRKEFIKSSIKSAIKSLVKIVVCIYILQAIILIFVPKIVPTESMTNTIRVNDVILTKPGMNPKRGELWGFCYKPLNYYFKRVIGEPGDTIEIKQGDVYVNGQYLQEDYIDYPIYEDIEPIELGKNEYYMMGDHRNGSFDSRDFGPVKKWKFRYKYIKTIGNINDLKEEISARVEGFLSGFNS